MASLAHACARTYWKHDGFALILSSVSWKMALAHQRTRAPQFFSSHCNQLIISFAWEKTDLISIAENWINKKNSRYTVVFSILQSVTTSRNLVQIFNQGFSFLSESNLNVYLCPTQCIDCSLMRVLMSPGLQRCYNYWECVLIISIK